MSESTPVAAESASASRMQAQLEVLETRSAFQERLLESLDAIVANQSSRLAIMERDLAALRGTLAALRDAGDERVVDEPPPPHY